MDKERFETGLAQRKATLGAEYVEQVLGNADDFTRPFQEMMTEWCWGFGWGRRLHRSQDPLHDEPLHDRRPREDA